MSARRPPRQPMFEPNTRFHVFIIVRLLGMGGVAEVYEALHNGKRCALKVLQRRFHDDAAQLARAEKEATVLTRIRHVNVIDVHDAGVHEGIFWMRMEFIEGIDLRTAIHRLAPMSVGLAGAWLAQAAHGAHQCHAFGVIHRDIKPENIFITRNNVVKLIDLGIAKMYGDLNTVQGSRDAPAPVGTAPYMSPEQARGELVTPGSDVYALAMSFQEAVVGEHPLLERGAIYEYWSMLHKQVHEKIPPLSEYGFPEELSDVIARALSKSPSRRQPTALAFARELISACNHHVEANPDQSHPGEPAVISMLEEIIESLRNPSFGTGPSPAHRSAVPARRSTLPRKPRTANGLGPSVVAVSMALPRGRADAVPEDERVTLPMPTSRPLAKGPHGTERMAPSASTLLAAQGKTLEDAASEARASEGWRPSPTGSARASEGAVTIATGTDRAEPRRLTSRLRLDSPRMVRGLGVLLLVMTVAGLAVFVRRVVPVHGPTAAATVVAASAVPPGSTSMPERDEADKAVSAAEAPSASTPLSSAPVAPPATATTAGPTTPKVPSSRADAGPTKTPPTATARKTKEPPRAGQARPAGGRLFGVDD